MYNATICCCCAADLAGEVSVDRQLVGHLRAMAQTDRPLGYSQAGAGDGGIRQRAVCKTGVKLRGKNTWTGFTWVYVVTDVTELVAVVLHLAVLQVRLLGALVPVEALEDVLLLGLGHEVGNYLETWRQTRAGVSPGIIEVGGLVHKCEVEGALVTEPHLAVCFMEGFTCGQLVPEHDE